MRAAFCDDNEKRFAGDSTLSKRGTSLVNFPVLAEQRPFERSNV